MAKIQKNVSMAAIRSKGTKPEMIIRRWLWRKGFRYRVNHNRLPGHPDIVLLKYHTCIFVNGCFWHGHGIRISGLHIVSSKNFPCFRLPKSNVTFWENKIIRNMERDKEEQRQLAKMGWHCLTIWECELSTKKREQTLQSLAYTLNLIYLQDHSVKKRYDMKELGTEQEMVAEDIHAYE